MKELGRVSVLLIILIMAGCASTSTTASDTLEKLNRHSWNFNYQILDKHILKPASQGYEKIPEQIRGGISNLLSNLNEPLYALNNLLQGKVIDSGSTVLRFVANSTVGILGIFDAATHISLPKKAETFAQTFGTWGISNGPYLMWPVYGASTARNTVGDFIDVLVYPLSLLSPEQMVGKFVVQGLDSRITYKQYGPLLEKSLDTYDFVKELYLQRDAHLVRDGQTDTYQSAEFEEEFDDELLDE